MPPLDTSRQVVVPSSARSQARPPAQPACGTSVQATGGASTPASGPGGASTVAAASVVVASTSSAPTWIGSSPNAQAVAAVSASADR